MAAEARRLLSEAEEARRDLLVALEWLREVEAKLRDANNCNRSLFEARVDPLVTIDTDRRIGDVNQATIRATGAPREQLVGSSFSDYFTDPAKARDGSAQVFREGSPVSARLLPTRGDGSPSRLRTENLF